MGWQEAAGARGGIAGCWMFVLLFLVSCATPAHRLTLYVDARGHDYSSVSALCHSLRAQRRRPGVFGHAWVCLQAPDGTVLFEGGHSGETGLLQPRYLEGVARLAAQGDPNPIRYLYEPQADGYLELGSGGHRPTHRCVIPIDAETAGRVLAYIEAYDFSTYCLSDHHCTHFVVGCAEIAGHTHAHTVTVPLEEELHLDGVVYRLWTDEMFATLKLSTPDALVRGHRGHWDGGCSTQAR